MPQLNLDSLIVCFVGWTWVYVTNNAPQFLFGPSDVMLVPGCFDPSKEIGLVQSRTGATGLGGIGQVRGKDFITQVMMVLIIWFHGGSWWYEGIGTLPEMDESESRSVDFGGPGEIWNISPRDHHWRLTAENGCCCAAISFLILQHCTILVLLCVALEGNFIHIKREQTQ